MTWHKFDEKKPTVKKKVILLENHSKKYYIVKYDTGRSGHSQEIYHIWRTQGIKSWSCNDNDMWHEFEPFTEKVTY